MAVVAPIGGVMGLDMATPGIMRRAPRPSDEAIIVRSMMIRLFVVGLLMATATLILVEIGKQMYDSLVVGQTMAIAGLAIMNIFVALNLRFPDQSVLGKATLSNPKLILAFAWAIVGTMLITEVNVLQEVFETVPLNAHQWGWCLLAGLILLVLGEVAKFVARAIEKEPAAA
jgi:Ca2+-transporting ATPase